MVTISEHPPAKKVIISDENIALMTAEALEGGTVTLIVGPSRQKYYVHKKILRDGSAFFDSVFQDTFIESSGMMAMPEDDSQAVADLIEYLYRGTIPEITKRGISPILNKRILELYFLAEKYCMLKIMNKILDTLVFSFALADGQFHGFPPQIVKNLFERTHRTSKLRELSAALMVCGLFYGLRSRKDMSERYQAVFRECPEYAIEILRLQMVHQEKLTMALKNSGRTKGPRFVFESCFEPSSFHVQENKDFERGIVREDPKESSPNDEISAASA